MKPRLFKALATASCLFLSSSVTTAQQSEQSAQPLETVVVTAVRQAYRGDFTFMETPQADTIINAEILTQVGALDLDQALDLSASVARQNNFGGLWNSFAVRGFVGDENLPSNYLVNGFNAGRGFGGPRDLSGIESVEVLKGPRAAIYGRGEPGGTINMITKRANFEQNGKVSLSAARYDAYRGDIDYNTPLSDDFAIRFVGFYEDAESFRDEIEKEAWGVSPSIVWNTSNRSRLVYELEYSDQEVPFDRGVVAIDDQLGRIPDSRFLGEPGDGSMKAKVVGHQVEWQYDINGDWSALVGFNYRDTSLKGFSTEAELSGSRQKLYVDGETLTRQRRSRDYDATYEVLRAEVTGSFHTGGLEHRIMVGADVDEFENDQVFLRIRAPSLSTNPTDQQLQAINVFDPVYGQYPLPTPLPLTDRVETQESFGVFLQDQISLTEQLDVRIGVRYDDYEQKLKNRLNDTQSDQSEDRWSPQVGAVYEATEDLSFYAVYGENFRPLSGVDAQGNGFDPNKTESIEAGIKVSLMNGALEGTLAVFQIEQNNIVVVDDPSAFTQAAIGEAESKGVELDIAGRLGENTSIWLSYAYVDAETKNAFFDANFAREIPAGTELLNIPKNQLNVQLAYDLTLGGRNLQFGGGLLYVDDRNGYFGTDFTLPDYTLVNAFAAYNLTDAFLARLEIQNLFDEEYYTNSFADLWVEPGAPTTWRVVAEYTF